MIAESPFARRVRLAEAAVEAREAVEAEEAAVAAAEAEAATPPIEWTFVAPGPDAVAGRRRKIPSRGRRRRRSWQTTKGRTTAAWRRRWRSRRGSEAGRWRPASVDVRVRTPRADAGAMLVDAAMASAPSRLSGCAVQ